jgi:apolipoprotein N-acyltransferase
MVKSRWLTGVCVLVFGAALVAAQQQATQPAQGRPRASRRLVQPWSQIKDLNEDVKTKIIEIHRKSVEERAAISAKEKQDIMALLTDDQKKQVNEYEAQAGQRARARRGAATRPAGQ